MKNHPNRVKWSENLYLSLFLMKSSSWKIDQVADKIDQVADRFFVALVSVVGGVANKMDALCHFFISFQSDLKTHMGQIV